MSDKIKPSEVSQVLLDQLKGISSAEKFDEVGTVLTVSDGVARIYGLRNAEANELLEFFKMFSRTFHSIFSWLQFVTDYSFTSPFNFSYSSSPLPVR